MTRRVHLVVFFLLIALGSAPLHGAARGSVSGLVRDSAGIPQVGAQVQLLRPDLSLIASVYTNSDGRFTIASVAPGRYAVKAMGDWFLPSLRENVRVRSNTIVNLTLNSLYEVMQWLPETPRAANARKDDWAWTLRSAANRPLLRWLEDGPLVVVSDSPRRRPRLMARLMASGQEGAFGESGERISAEVENTPSDSRELLARVDFAPGTDAGMESMLGFRQDLGFAGSVQSVAAIALHPEMDAAGSEGLNEAAVRSWETIHLGDEFEVEAGSNQVLARLSSVSPDTVVALLPFASAGWINGNSTVGYRMTTMMPDEQNRGDAQGTEAQSWLPALSARDGALAMEHGLHQELGWERQTDLSDVSVQFYADKIDNPAVEAMSNFTAGDPAAGMVLLDSVSGLIHAAGPGFSTAGVTASFQHALPGGHQMRVSYADGGALVMPALSADDPQSISLAELVASLQPRRAQSYSLSLSGTLDGSGTRWRASYRWQPEDTITAVAPFAPDGDLPYLSLHLRQPLHLRTDGANRLDLLLEVRNLLAQGYRPFLTSDGSLLLFSQDQRGIRAGLALTF